MAETQISELIRASLDGIRNFTGTDTFIGEAIETRGITVIPVSRVSIAFATGGVDYGARKIVTSRNFGGGGGTSVSITPIAFLTVNDTAQIDLIPVANQRADAAVGRLSSLMDKTPDLIQKIKQIFL